MKISVIVPVYNVEGFLVKCVESITNQTYRDLEIILVDDGSTDNSPALCDTIAKTDERIKVIHKQNGGLSSARNAGLDVMTGDFVAFVDSDDFIHPQMYEKLVELIVNNDADVASCQYRFVKEDENVYFEQLGNTEKISVIYGNETLEKFNEVYRRVSIISACMRLCKKELFEDLRFVNGYFEEDSMLLLYLLEKTNKWVRTSDVLYYWTERLGSITRRGFTPKRFHFIMVSYVRTEFFKERHLEKMREFFSREFMNRTLNCYCNAKHYGFEKEFSEYKKMYNKNWHRYYFKSGFCFNEYLMHFCFRFNIPYGEKIYKKLIPNWLEEI